MDKIIFDRPIVNIIPKDPDLFKDGILLTPKTEFIMHINDIEHRGREFEIRVHSAEMVPSVTYLMSLDFHGGGTAIISEFIGSRDLVDYLLFYGKIIPVYQPLEVVQKGTTVSEVLESISKRLVGPDGMPL